MKHRTAVHEAVVTEGWGPIPGTDLEWTLVPVEDSTKRLSNGRPVMARLTYRDALAVAERHDARLISPDEVQLRHEMAKRGEALELVAYTGTPTAETDLVHSERHDADCWRQLEALGWDGQPVANFGKHWVHGAPKGRAWLMGWWVPKLEAYGMGYGPGFVQPRPLSGSRGPHDDQHHDDGTTTVLVRPARASIGSRIVSGLSSAVSWLVSGLRPTAVLVKPTLGEALLDEARKDLHVREVGGMNRGPEVDDYNLALGVPMGSSWCASSLTTWLRRACVRLGVPMPITGSAGAKTIMGQLQKAGRWLDVAELRRNPKLLRPGMILVWDRGGWKGHVGVFAAMRGERGLATVEGNSGSGPFGEGNRVADDMPRTLDDPRLLGAGWVD